MTYVTHPNPPAGDDSQKIATTAWVKDITDALEKGIDDVSATVSGGMNAVAGRLTRSGSYLVAPSGGGTYFCMAILSSNTNSDELSFYSGNYASGSNVVSLSNRNEKISLGIKIA